jgi:hypothetical protein
MKRKSCKREKNYRKMRTICWRCVRGTSAGCPFDPQRWTATAAANDVSKNNCGGSPQNSGRRLAGWLHRTQELYARIFLPVAKLLAWSLLALMLLVPSTFVWDPTCKAIYAKREILGLGCAAGQAVVHSLDSLLGRANTQQQETAPPEKNGVGGAGKAPQDKYGGD